MLATLLLTAAAHADVAPIPSGREAALLGASGTACCCGLGVMLLLVVVVVMRSRGD